MNQEKLDKDSEILRGHLQSEAEKLLRHHGYDLDKVDCLVDVQVTLHTGAIVSVDFQSESNYLLDLLSKPAHQLPGASVRLSNCITNSFHDEPLFRFLQRSAEAVSSIRNFGKRSFKELESLLERHGLKFGMTIVEMSELVGSEVASAMLSGNYPTKDSST